MLVGSVWPSDTCSNVHYTGRNYHNRQNLSSVILAHSVYFMLGARSARRRMKLVKYFLLNLPYPLFFEGQPVTRAHCHKLLWVLLWLISVSMVHAGNNVWTSSGPAGVDVLALAIDPITPTTLYAGTFDPAGSGRGGVYKSTN